MKIGPFMIGKDGGPESNVDWVLFEIKCLFSVGVLRFTDGSREAFHSHAFNCWSWLLKGMLVEQFLDTKLLSRMYFPKLAPIVTTRKNVHQVTSCGNSYVLTFRGPWKKTWVDAEEIAGLWAVKTLTDSRKVDNVEYFYTRELAAAYAQRIA